MYLTCPKVNFAFGFRVLLALLIKYQGMEAAMTSMVEAEVKGEAVKMPKLLTETLKARFIMTKALFKESKRPSDDRKISLLLF